MKSFRLEGAALVLGLLALTPGMGRADDLEAATAARLGDYSSAVARWQAFAQQGDPDAAYHLGEAYETGHGVTRDPVRADYWLRAAATNGSGPAAYILGLRAENAERPDGTPQNLGAAIAWYRRALDAGDPRARGRLAALGAGEDPRAAPSPPFGEESSTPVIARPPVLHPPVPHSPAPPPIDNFDKAVTDWRTRGVEGTNSTTIAALETAARQGQPMAQYDLAYAYEHGLGVPAEPVKAYAWYTRAEAASSAPARLREAARTNGKLLAATLSDSQKQAAERVIAR